MWQNEHFKIVPGARVSRDHVIIVIYAEYLIYSTDLARESQYRSCIDYIVLQAWRCTHGWDQ